MFESVPVFPLTTPALRPVELVPVQAQGRTLLLVRDPAGVIEGTALIVPDPLLLVFMEMADGRTPCSEMARRVTQATGQILSAGTFESLVKQLDEALLLQSERFRDALVRKYEAYLHSPVRPSTVFREGGQDRLALIKALADELRRHRAGAFAPPAHLDLPPNSVVAILSPHIDYGRGGQTYAWSYKALREYGPPVRTCVVLGTCHRPTSHLFVATRKDFETPLGTVETDTEVLDALDVAYGGELYQDEYAHAGEHAIELQAIYLRHVFGDGQPPKIVPILVGSFDELLANNASPREHPEIGAFCGALRTVLDERDGAVAIIGGVDLSHCGPQFGDEQLNDPDREREIEAGDRAALAALESGDPDAFFDSFRQGENPRKVCSIAAIYCVMEAMRGRATPRVLSYRQSNSEDRTCLVSYASVAFVRDTPGHAAGGRLVIVSG